MKLDQKGRSSLLLSYIEHGGGYVLWDLHQKNVIRLRDVIFDDSIFPYKFKVSLPSTPPATVDVFQPWPIRSTKPTGPRIGLSAPSNRRLTALVHNPNNAFPPRLVPLPDSNDDDLNTLPASPVAPSSPVPPAPVPDPVSPPRRLSRHTGRSAAPQGVPTSPPSGPRQSSRKTAQPQRLGNWAKLSDLLDDVDTPKTWRQLLKSPNKTRWLRAADEEFSSLIGMEPWKLVP